MKTLLTDKKKAAHHFMVFGAYAMSADAAVRVLVASLSTTPFGHALHVVHDLAAIIGSNGAALAGIGAVIDFSIKEAGHAKDEIERIVHEVLSETVAGYEGLGG